MRSNSKSKLMPHVLDTYTTDEIKNMVSMYTEGVEFNYGLQLQVGDIIKGKIITQSKTDYLFDIGYKDYLRVEIKRSESNSLDNFSNEEGYVPFNQEIEILITDIKDNPYTIKGSISALQKKFTYEEILRNSDEPIIANVLSVMSAGFNLELIHNNYKIPAFMPNILAGVNKISPEQSDAMVGRQIEVMVESFMEEKGTFVVSRKKYLQSLIPQEIAKLFTIDKEGNPQPFKGIVTGFTKFGIFVEFNGCLTGMIHKDNLSDMYKDMYTTMKSGDEIPFFIKEIGKNDRLILTQVWKQSLWDVIEKDVELVGVIGESKQFGTLVRLDDETVGLILPTDMEKNGKNLSIGQNVNVRVTTVNRDDRKIYLKIIK